MRISTFFYTIGQGIKSTFKNKWFTLASIATISACLFLFGVCFSIVMNFRNMIKNAENGVSVTVLFDEGISDERIAQIGEIINSHSAVSKAVFVSADEAWESFKVEYLGEYADGFTENPLAESENYQIYLNDVSRQAEFVSYMETIDGVRQVNRSEITADTFVGLEKAVAYVSIAIIVILLCVSIFLISNTVTIGIAVRKEEISIMKYIGATDYFVRAPFVIEGIIIGAIGSLVPLAIIYFSYNEIIKYVSTEFSVLKKFMVFLPVTDIFHYLLPISVALGVGIGFFGSLFTVRRHLHV